MSREVDYGIHAFEQARYGAGVLQAEYMQPLRRDIFAMAAREVIDHGHFKTAIQ
jgi:hypothetical protein